MKKDRWEPLIRIAVENEREKCAQILDRFASRCESGEVASPKYLCRVIADEIRSRPDIEISVKRPETAAKDPGVLTPSTVERLPIVQGQGLDEKDNIIGNGRLSTRPWEQEQRPHVEHDSNREAWRPDPKCQ